MAQKTIYLEPVRDSGFFVAGRVGDWQGWKNPEIFWGFIVFEGELRHFVDFGADSSR